jgi:uncharacterized alkaline shock family protein YloU
MTAIAEPVRTTTAVGRPAPIAAGRTTVASRVLERIATQVLSELDRAGGAARRVLGVPLGRERVDRAPQVHARVDGHLATMRVSIVVAYPTPLRAVTRQLRDLMTTRVGQLTGLQLRQLDIDIAQLTTPEPAGRSVS